MIWRAALLAVALAAAPVQAGAFCKMALALGLDISSSVNTEEYHLQILGLADALETDDVIAAILSPEGTHIAAAAFEWSGYQQQDTIVEWSVLDTPDAVRGFAARLRAHQRPYWDFATAVGKGVEYGAKLLARGPDCARRVLDMSGDGQNNVGVDPRYFLDLGLLDGITINGLVIKGASPDPEPYYHAQVKQGPGSFVMVARDFTDYRRVIRNKLLREIGHEMVLGRK